METWEVSGFEPRTVGILGLNELMMANFRQLNFKREEMRVGLQCDPGEGRGTSSSRVPCRKGKVVSHAFARPGDSKPGVLCGREISSSLRNEKSGRGLTPTSTWSRGNLGFTGEVVSKSYFSSNWKGD